MLNRLMAGIAIAAATQVAQAGEVRKVTLDVKGMDCAACPLTVKVLLQKQPGVSEVKVDADKHTARVEFDAAKASAEQLARAVTEAGYPTTSRK